MCFGVVLLSNFLVKKEEEEKESTFLVKYMWFIT